MVDFIVRLNTVQGEFYRVGADISRIEQSIQHHRDTQQRQSDDFKQVSDAWQELQQHVEDDKAKLQDVTQSIESKQPVMESCSFFFKDSITPARVSAAATIWLPTRATHLPRADWGGFLSQAISCRRLGSVAGRRTALPDR